ncbi:MAG: InlB B-repeat-containing protein [Allobaculum sp.]|nr:InlB B-repeat-containing protein [Allobaculum sp.]
MAYEKQFWIDHLVADDDPELVLREGNIVEAKRLNHMEDGISECSLAIEAIQNLTTPIQERGYVASVEFSEEGERRLTFVRSDGTVLSIPLANQTYQVSYYDGATLLFSDIVESGKNSNFAIIPTRPSTAQYDYTFLGWSSTSDGEVEEGVQNGITDNANLYAVFEATLRSYTITFTNGDEVLQTDTLDYGEIPVYSGSTLTSTDGRPFDKWVPELGTVTGAVAYQASYKHKLTYYDGSTLLKTEYVGDGQSPATYNPTKASTAQYSYSFSGWSTTKNATTPSSNALSPLTTDRVLYAVFASTVRSYTVTWNMNGTTQTATYNYGQTPTAPNVSAADGRSFSSWDKTITAVTGDVTYTARYQRRVRFYNGSTLLTTQYVDYGKNITYSGSTPTKASTTTLTYSFSGWASSSSGTASSTILNNITADKDVYAIFTSSTRYYAVKFYNGSTLLQTVNVTYNSNASYTGSTPTKSSTAQYSYSFSGWASSSTGSVSSTILNNITADKSVYAIFTATTRSYSVKFYNGSTLLQTKTVTYGSNASYTGSTPTKASTNTLTYSFSGWASSSSGTASSTILNNITADKNVYAVFTSATRYYSVKFYNGSTLLQTKSVTYNSDASYTGTTPTKNSTAQYNYTFSGWASSSGGSASSTILKNITASKSVYAAFTSAVRYYSVSFLLVTAPYSGDHIEMHCYNNNGLESNFTPYYTYGLRLQESSCAYGSTPVFSMPAIKKITILFYKTSSFVERRLDITLSSNSTFNWTPTISTVTGAIAYGTASITRVRVSDTADHSVDVDYATFQLCGS